MAPQVEITIVQEPVYVTTFGGYEPDPEWTFTDAAGHVHDASHTTLTWVVTHTYWCEECRDEHEEGEYRCSACGDKIVPGTIYIPPGTQIKLGQWEATLTVDDTGMAYALTREQLDEGQLCNYSDEWVAKVTNKGGCDGKAAGQ